MSAAGVQGATGTACWRVQRRPARARRFIVWHALLAIASCTLHGLAWSHLGPASTAVRYFHQRWALYDGRALATWHKKAYTCSGICSWRVLMLPGFGMYPVYTPYVHWYGTKRAVCAAGRTDR